MTPKPINHIRGHGKNSVQVYQALHPEYLNSHTSKDVWVAKAIAGGELYVFTPVKSGIKTVQVMSNKNQKNLEPFKEKGNLASFEVFLFA